MLYKRILWWIKGHLVWKSTDQWQAMAESGDFCCGKGTYDYVPRKRFMSAYEWWVKYSAINSAL